MSLPNGGSPSGGPPKIEGFGRKNPNPWNFNKVFHYFHHPFWGVYHPCFWKHPYGMYMYMEKFAKLSRHISCL